MNMKHKKIFLLTLLVLLLIACSGQSSEPSAQVNETPETTRTNKPLNAETQSTDEATTEDEVTAQDEELEASAVEVSVSLVNETTVTVAFSEGVDPITAANAANYAVNGKAPSQVRYDAAKQRALLILGEPLDPNGEHIVGVANVQDLSDPPQQIMAGMPLMVSAATLQVEVDVEAGAHEISPYIYGMAGPPVEYIEELGITLHRWGGNANSRYNWKVGNAWNAGHDWYYINTDYDNGEGSIADEFVKNNNELGVATLLTIPTLGWVAKDTSRTTCSFPLPDGTCGNANNANCEAPGEIADPNVTSVEAPPEFMVEWVEHLTKELGYDVPFLAMGNEPDISGVTHYDVHPECAGYDEIYERFVNYGAPIKEVAPESEILGPISCCWWYYWNSMLGSEDKRAHDGMDFLPWFLQQMAAYESENGQRLLDVLTIHYYPADLYNDDVSPEVAAHRTRSTRSLWDSNYVDESWIAEPIYLIPRMKGLIDQYYPDTKFGIGEWNFGAETTMNGAVTIADVLGIFGREDLYFASYWRYPEAQTPGYYAFKMYTNYDEAGSRFGDISVQAESKNWNKIGSYAAIDSESGNLHVMLINKQPEEAEMTQVVLNNFASQGNATQYRYHGEDEGIVSSTIEVSNTFDIELPPYSITLLVIEPEA